MTRPLLLALAAAMVLSGCFPRHARADRINARLARSVGQPITKVVSAAGPPVERFQNGENAVWVWEEVGDTQAETDAVDTYGGGRNYTTTVHTNRCRVWFDVNPSGVIVGWHWRGTC